MSAQDFRINMETSFPPPFYILKGSNLPGYLGYAYSPWADFFC